MWKQILVTAVCLLYLISGLVGIALAESASEEGIVPMDGYGDMPPVNGDWNVWNDTYVGNETIMLNGNLTIHSGGCLTFKNVTLKMNCTSNGQRYIEVLNGGTMRILDFDENNITIEDASWITSFNPTYKFNFWVRAGSYFEFRNSNLTECGYFWGGVVDKEGLLIQTDDAIVDHSVINNCSKGIILHGSDAVVSNNTIEWCDYGIRATSWSNGTIENNLIAWSDTCGIRIDGKDNTVKKSSNPFVRNNTIIKTGRDVLNKGDAISIQYYSNPTLLETKVLDWGEDGIYIGEQCHPIIESCVFDGQGGNYGLASSSPRTVRITNSTVNNTALWDISLATAYFVLTNCTANYSKVIFQGTDSNLTVNWFLNTYVNDTIGNSVSNANIRIQDNANGTFDENFTTDSNGFVNWTVLREYFQKDIDGDKNGDDVGERINYSPYNISVEKNGYFSNYTLVEINESKYITITLQADEKPIADAGPDQSVNEDEKAYFNGSGSTDDVGIVWYNWTFGDGNYNNGTNITTNHTYTNAGTYIVTLNVTDTIGQWDTDTSLVFVNNVGPSADAGSNKIVNEGEAVLFDGSASTDTPSDQSNLIYTWYFGDGKTDTGMSVSHVYGDDGIYTATLIVTDDNGFVDSNTTIVTVNNVAPSIEPVPAQTIMEDSLFTLKINASDVPGDTLTFSDNTTLFDIDPVTGLIEFTPRNDDVGNHSINITVTDDDGGVNYTILSITIENTNDPPVIELISQQSAIEDVEFTLQVNANDVDSGDVLTYSLTTYPPEMSIDDTDLITWTPTNDDVRTHTVTVKVEDVAGAFDTKTFTIIVSSVNDAPTIITTSLANATKDVFYMAFVHADDIDAGDTLTYSLDAYPAFLSINPLTGQIFGTPDNEDVGTHSVVVNVTDGDDYATKTFDLIVINVNDSPVIASNPILMAKVNELYSYDITASDIDTGDVLSYSLVEGPEGMIINGTKITWTPSNEQQGKTFQFVVEVSDGEATTTQSFTITVEKITEPDNLWLALVLGLVGGVISGVIITWIMNQRKKEEEIEERDGGF